MANAYPSMTEILDSSTAARKGTSVAIPRWKRALDLTCICVSLPVVLPVGLVLAGGILIVSPGPILYAQQRVGCRGRHFWCLKFRSMKNGSDIGAHKNHAADLIHSPKPWAKMDGTDSRLIPLGKLLRASGLDELPQLVNVIRGEMSLVGPRPCTPYEFSQYLPWQKARVDGPPGLTGLWQVTGKGKTTFAEMVSMDIQYLKGASFWLDLKIILKTIPTLIGQVVGMLTMSKSKPVEPPKPIQGEGHQ